MTFTEAIETLLDLDRQGALVLQDVCPGEEWKRFEEAMKAVRNAQNIEGRRSWE